MLKAKNQAKSKEKATYYSNLSKKAPSGVYKRWIRKKPRLRKNYQKE